MVTEIAFFTPKIRSGTAVWLDCWNVDQFDKVSDLQRCLDNDAIEMRGDLVTWLEGYTTEFPNGVIQAIFRVDTPGDYMVTAKVSSSLAWLNMYIDDHITVFKEVMTDGDLIVGVAYLDTGLHSATLKQLNAGYVNDFEDDDIWFHSFKVELLD